MDAQPCSSTISQQQRCFADTAVQTDDNNMESHGEIETKLNDEDFLSSSSSQCSVESSKTTTRRSSVDSFNLGTPLRHLFHSTSVSSASPVSSTSEENVLDSLNQLLHRITSERFLELRRIQLGDRPVTNGNARENLENFFNRAINGPTEEQRNEEEQANRPETVVNDVRSLMQLSRVQSALQNDFRRQLESTLSGQVTNTERPTNRLPAPQARLPTLPAPRPNDNTRIGGDFRSRLEETLSGRVISNRQHLSNARHTRHNTEARRPNNNQNISSTPTQRQLPPPPPSPPSATLRNTVDVSVQLLTESIATDITRLQSLQVVSNMLRTDFRQELERMVEQRVETAGGDGESVEQFVRSLPGNRDTIHRQQRSYFQESPSTSNEIHELRQQIGEMKEMMAMSMEVQLDTQRAIRQEVSAIFTAFMQDYLTPRTGGNSVRPSTPATFAQPTQSTPIAKGQCVICIDGAVDTVLYQCGHMCVCHTCGLKLKMEGQNCPMCRAAIRDVIRAYVINE